MSKLLKISAAFAGLLVTQKASAQYVENCNGNICESSTSGYQKSGPSTVYTNQAEATYSPNEEVYKARHRAQEVARSQETSEPDYRTAPREGDQGIVSPTRIMSGANIGGRRFPDNQKAYSHSSESEVVCAVKGHFTAAYRGRLVPVDIESVAFHSVENFQYSKWILSDKGYLSKEYISALTCGPKTVEAISQALIENPEMIKIGPDLRMSLKVD